MRTTKVDKSLDWIGLFLMEQAPRLMEPGRMDTVATTILLLETGNLKVREAARRSIRSKTCRIDARLVSDLYEACPPRLKPALASSHAIAELAPNDFHPIYEDAYRRQMPAIARRDLALGLSIFLQRHPEEVLRYRSIILELLRSRQQQPCLIGMAMAALIPDLEFEDLEIIERKLSARYSEHRGQALYTIYKLMQRRLSVADRVLDFCTSERILGRVRKLRREDPDPFVRLHARQVLEAHGKLPRKCHARYLRTARSSHRRGPKSKRP